MGFCVAATCSCYVSSHDVVSYRHAKFSQHSPLGTIWLGRNIFIFYNVTVSESKNSGHDFLIASRLRFEHISLFSLCTWRIFHFRVLITHPWPPPWQLSLSSRASQLHATARSPNTHFPSLLPSADHLLSRHFYGRNSTPKAPSRVLTSAD